MSSETVSGSVTAIVKTFERPASLDRLIDSIERYRPDLKVMVADDGFEPTLRKDVDYLRLPPDVGVSAGRNALLELVTTPYFLLLDDDVEFTADTDLEGMLAVASRPGITLAAGDLVDCRMKSKRRKRWRWSTRQKKSLFNWHGVMDRRGDELTLVPHAYHLREEDHYICDFVHNFFIARTEPIRAMGGWDVDLKSREHLEFFIRLKEHGYRAAYCPGSRVSHWRDRPARYSRFRRRDYSALAMRKHGINVFKNVDGTIRILDLPKNPDTELLHPDPAH